MRPRPAVAAFLVLPAAALLAAIPAPRAFGRSAAAQDQGTIRVGVSLVNLYATVRDKHKAIVPDLKQEDFHIYEDDKEQKVAFFSREKTLPITLALLIDTSGSERFMIESEKAAASRFLGEVIKQKDEALVISFDTDVDLLADWTGDLGELNRAVRRAQINAPSSGGPVTVGPFPTSGSGGTNFYDAVYLACHDKMATETGRKALIVLTDAEDNGSKLTLKEAVEAAQRADTVVHMLLVYDPRYGADSRGAGQLAGDTGGRVIDVHSEKKMQEAFDEISDELRSEYVLGYYPTNDKRDGSFRKIRVEVTDKDNKVLTRKGYYAPEN
ncbi:MAG TPA: VWA domain-containing protein [Candidatus Acidoferrales bacterium]|nr:VWA domain-containing protein [Candidatus Acidoferrales bacterium]